MKTILLCFDDDTFTSDELARVHAQADGYEVLLTKDRAAIEAKLDDVEIAAGAFPRDLLGRASNLRWWQQWGAGADWLLDAPEVRAMEFTLTNTSGIHAIQISEHIFAFLLAFGRNLPQAMDAQREHIWVSNHWQASHSSTIRPGQKFNYYISHQAVFELAGKTMVLVGVGAIGLRTARLAQAFDLRVIGVRRHADRALPHVDRVVGPDDLHSVLPEADFVVVTAPLTPETAKRSPCMLGEVTVTVTPGSGSPSFEVTVPVRVEVCVPWAKPAVARAKPATRARQTFKVRRIIPILLGSN